MKFLPLVWAMLWRSRARTWLTFLSIAVAFFLFGMLEAVESGFMGGVRLSMHDRLVVTHRQGLTAGILPLAHLTQIDQVKGVTAVNPLFPFGGYWQDPKQIVQGVAVDPDPKRDTDDRITGDPAHAAAFRTIKSGMLAGRELAEKYGWKVGDRIPLVIQQHRKDGTQNWEFDLVGTFWYDEVKMGGRHVPANFVLIRYDYWNDAMRYPNLVLWYFVKIADPTRATAIGKAIDALFVNSTFPTRTQRESEFQASFLRQMGSIGTIVTSVLAAVFFTLVLVAGNTMMQAFRERTAELAVMKTLGFSNGTIAALLVTESVALCLAAGGLGLALSLTTVPALQAAGMELPLLEIEDATVAAGIVLAVAIGAIAAIVPAWKGARLSVVEALAVT